MKKYLCALLLAGVGLGISVPQAIAQEGSTGAKKTVKKPAPKKTGKKSSSKAKASAAAGAGAAAVADEDDIVPDITGSTTMDYQCEMGNKVTVYENQTDSQHVGLRWKQKLHRLKRVSTTTGASRFENKKYGLVWIGIPAKGMLLDSKKGQQLANECKTPTQMQPIQQDLITKAGEATESAPASTREQTDLAAQ